MLYHIQNTIYDIVSYATFIIYIALELGLLAAAPEYLDDLQFYTKIYVALFLIIRFNPLRKASFTELDGKIAFGAGVFLISTTAMTTVLTNKFIRVKNFAHKMWEGASTESNTSPHSQDVY
jgi:hypothetical protein